MPFQVFHLMKKKIYSLSAMFIMAFVVILSVTSCVTDDPYYYPTTTDILTSNNWELVAVNDRPVNEIDVCEFQFFNFGNGTYGRYNEYGNWSTISIEWETAIASGGAQYLYVYPAGTGQSWDYIMRIYDGYTPTLELTDLFTGDKLTFQPY